MRFVRWSGAVLIILGLVGAAYFAQEAEPSGVKMTNAAQKFVASLKDDQKLKALLAFDDPNRTGWYFTPQQDQKKQPTRKGLMLKAMDEGQRKLVVELLAAGTSAEGKAKALDIMSLEMVLRELEKGAGPGRDPEWYFLTIFGTPAAAGNWGWRLEGHHLSLNYVVKDGKVASATPCFYGSNPREVLAGDRKGHRALPKEEDFVRQLVKSLSDEQQKVAILSTKTPNYDIPEGKAQPQLDESPKGLAVGKMTDEQKKLVRAVLAEYAGRLSGDMSGTLMNEVIAAGLDKVHFAWWGGLEPRQGHIYRLQGPTFIVEFICVQNDANHIHSVWRSAKNDFGKAGN